MAKKCTKKCGAHAELWFCQSKAIAFLPFSLMSLPSLLKLPKTMNFTSASEMYETVLINKLQSYFVALIVTFLTCYIVF